MDSRRNQQTTRYLASLADQHGFTTQVFTTRFSDGGDGYSVKLSAPEGQVLSFYNDDTHGPRFSGLCGVLVPGQRVADYVRFYAENPAVHPAEVNRVVLGRG